MDTQYECDNLFLNLKCVPEPFFLEKKSTAEMQRWSKTQQQQNLVKNHTLNSFTPLGTSNLTECFKTILNKTCDS